MSTLPRTLFFASSIAALLVIARPSGAAIFLSATKPTYLPDANLVSVVLHAHATAGEIIQGISAPSITTISGQGLHQVWTPTAVLPTPTLQSHLLLSPLWSNAWEPYDSYWFFDNSNSLTVGGPFTETNNQTGGAVLPPNSFGSPVTGFGSLGATAGSTSAAFNLASGIPGQDVDFAQLVTRVGDGPTGTMSVFTDQGNSQFLNLGILLDDPTVFVTRTTLTVSQGQSVSSLFQAICPGIVFQPTITWSNFQFTGPGTGTQPQFDFATHQFSWDTTGSSIGTYQASVTAAHLPGFPSTATLTINVVPEPAPAALIVLAFAWFSQSIRCRKSGVLPGTSVT